MVSIFLRLGPMKIVFQEAALNETSRWRLSDEDLKFRLWTTMWIEISDSDILCRTQHVILYVPRWIDWEAYDHQTTRRDLIGRNFWENEYHQSNHISRMAQCEWRNANGSMRMAGASLDGSILIIEKQNKLSLPKERWAPLFKLNLTSYRNDNSW